MDGGFVAQRVLVDGRAPTVAHDDPAGFMNAASPGVIALFQPNDFYPDDDAYLEALAEAIHKCPDNAAAREVGIEWCLNQSRELMAHGVPCLHYYSMGKSESIRRVAAGLF